MQYFKCKPTELRYGCRHHTAVISRLVPYLEAVITLSNQSLGRKPLYHREPLIRKLFNDVVKLRINCFRFISPAIHSENTIGVKEFFSIYDKEPESAECLGTLKTG